MQVCTNEEICSICLDNIKQEKTITQCNHSFHTFCINNWLGKRKNCPICRTEIRYQSKYIIDKYYHVSYIHQPNHFIGKLKRILIGSDNICYEFVNVHNSIWDLTEIVYVFDMMVNISEPLNY